VTEVTALKNNYSQEKKIKLQELRNLAEAISKKIKNQMPDCPEGALFHAVLNQALKDAISVSNSRADAAERDSARRYLSGYVWHAEAAGVCSDWLQRIFAETDLFNRADQVRAL
jgi:hypothetical protein